MMKLSMACGVGILAALLACASGASFGGAGEKTGAAAESNPFFAHPAIDHGTATNPSATPQEKAALRQRLEGEAKGILAMTDAQVLAVVPDQTPLIHNPCPACARRKPAGTPQQPPPFPGVFDPLHPGEIRCANCGTVFPSADFPMTGKETFRNMLGEDIEVPYYADQAAQAAAPGTRNRQPRRYYLGGVIDTARKAWLVPRLSALAQLYHLTGDERYARVAVRVLDAWAARYPHYLLTTDYAQRYTTTKGRSMPYGYIDTRWGRRSYDDVPSDLLSIFDLVAASQSMDAAAKGRIREGLFLDPVRRSQKGPRNYGNISPISAMIDRAKVLESPDLIHECLEFIRDVPRYTTECDGMFLDSAGYASLFRYTFFQGARKLEGYSDPPGYMGKDGLHLENVQVMKDMEEYFRALTTVSDKLRLPSGGLVSYNDSGSGWGDAWWSAYGESCRPPGRSANILLPGLRRAILGAGDGDRQIQVNLDFGENGVNHAHQDSLCMQIYAYGHSLIDDFTYHKSILRRYGEMSLVHQTVIIDHENQNRAATEGDLGFYAPLMDGVAAIRVDNTRTYAGRARQYARTLVLNSIDVDVPYVIDVFEVAGGALHDYHLRSSAQHPESLAVSAATTPVPGLRPLMAPGEAWKEPGAQREGLGTGYGLLFNVRRADVPPALNFTFDCKDPWAAATRASGGGGGQQRYKTDGAFRAGPDSWPDKPAVGTRHHVVVGPGYEMLTAESPSLMEAGFTGLDKPTEEWPRLPHVILRHRVEKDGKSVFVVVHEPYHHAPKIKAVTRIATGDEQVLALRIDLPDRQDTFVYALDRARDVRLEGVEMSGRLGLISRASGKAARAYLVEGTRLTSDGVKLTEAAASYSGAIQEMQRRWDNKGLNRFRVDNASLPAGDALHGSVIIVRNGKWSPRSGRGDGGGNGGGNDEGEAQPQPGAPVDARAFAGASQAFEIDRVAVENGQTWVYTQGDHGLMMDGDKVTEFYFPRRTFQGRAAFLIPTAATTHPLASARREQPLVLTPVAQPPSGLKPGLLVEDFTGSGHDFSKLKSLGSQLVDRIDVKRFELRKSGDNAARYTGYLRVPADGVYSLHVGATSECRMTLGGVPVIEQFRGQSLMPDVREVKLTRGLYPLTLEYFYAGGRMPAWCSADWEGPAMPRQDMVKSAVAKDGRMP